jgi:hypothetical protein
MPGRMEAFEVAMRFVCTAAPARWFPRLDARSTGTVDAVKATDSRLGADRSPTKATVAAIPVAAKAMTAMRGMDMVVISLEFWCRVPGLGDPKALGLDE